MSDPFDTFLRDHPDLAQNKPASGERERLFRIRLPPLCSARHFAAAWLVLPAGFPDVCARIRLSPDAVLKVPHVDSAGGLCFSGDAGPASGASPEHRIQDMLYRFSEEFLKPWQEGRLDGDFAAESQNYWEIHIARCEPRGAPVHMIYTVDERPARPRLVEAVLLLPLKAVIVGEPSSFVERIRNSFGPRASQVVRAMVLDIPVDFAFTPATWPKNKKELALLLEMRVDESTLRQFNAHKRKAAQHSLVLLRAPSGSYGYHLDGGPVQQAKKGQLRSHRPDLQLLPLIVYRLDPAWTSGRGSNPDLIKRQLSHVLVIGAGALGSSVIDQLARAGIGRISIVDPDSMEAANVGRHLLGVESIGVNKAQSVAGQVARSTPACRLSSHPVSAQNWLGRRPSEGIDLILDLTGEPEVRFALESSRRADPVPLVIGWMEPYVAAAHACILLPETQWFRGDADPMEQLQSVAWPDDVIQREPGCSSRFQSYTPAAAAYAVGLVSEAALDVIDGRVGRSNVRSWVRAQRYLDRQRQGVFHRAWVDLPDGVEAGLMQRDFHV